MPIHEPKAGSILVWTLFLGLVAGSLELAVFLLKCQWLDPRNYNLGRHFPWMFPVCGVLLLAGPGLVLAVSARLWPRRVSAILVLCVLTFPAFLGLLFRGPILTAFCLILAAGLAYRASRFLAARLEAFDRVARVGSLVMGGLLALTMAVCFGREAWVSGRLVSPPSGSKNVILIVLDTVRAENLSLYGYGRDTTPNLVAIAERGVRFDQAYSTAPWTAPSHAGMFTGRAAHELSIGWDRPLDRKDATLAGVLGGRGYDTAGFVANTTYCSYETGLDRGFAHYEDYDITLRGMLLCSSVVQRLLNFSHKHPGVARWLGESDRSSGDRKSAARINRDFLGWVDGRRATRPFFAFLNYFDAHHPYLSPDLGSGPALGREPVTKADFQVLKTWWESDKAKVQASEIKLAVDSYDRCIRYLDDQLGRLFADLDRRGILKDSLVIVTADHGEHLGERNLFGHGCSVYRPELHVPLLVIEPGMKADRRVVDEPVSLRDLPSTVVERLGIPSVFPGRSLSRCWSGVDSTNEPVLSGVAGPPEDDPNRGRSPARLGPLVSLVDRRHHYIRDGRGREELYDLKVDPAEIWDLAGLPESVDELTRFRLLMPDK